MKTRVSVSIPRNILWLLSALLLGCGSVFAQGTASAALGGTVSDQKGGVITGATVTVTNKATGTGRTATTNDSGEYRLDLLPAGSYDLKVSASGFGDMMAEN